MLVAHEIQCVMADLLLSTSFNEVEYCGTDLWVTKCSMQP